MDPQTHDPDAAAPVAVTVVRTGGVAGMRRRWHVESEPPEADRWIALIERCPWETVSDDQAAGTDRSVSGADRFIWAIHARCADDRREATLPDAQATGPWRDLIDEVREPRHPEPPRPV